MSKNKPVTIWNKTSTFDTGTPATQWTKTSTFDTGVPATIWRESSDYTNTGVRFIIDTVGAFLVDTVGNFIVDTGMQMNNVATTVWSEDDSK